MPFPFPGIKPAAAKPADPPQSPQGQTQPPQGQPQLQTPPADDDDDFEIDDPEALTMGLLSTFASSQGMGDSDDDDDTELTEAEQQALQASQTQRERESQQQIANFGQALQNFALPSDFDVSRLASDDPAEQAAALQEYHQHSAMNLTNALMPILEMAMTSMVSDMNETLEKRLQNLQNGMQSDKKLETLIPQYADPALQPVIKQLDKQLRGAGIKEMETRAKHIKKMLSALPAGKKGSGSGARRESGGASTDLGSYFGRKS